MNKSAVAREFWRKIFNENAIDLRNSDARKSVVSDFLNDPQNQKDGWNNTSDKRFFRAALDKIMRENGKSTSSIGVKPEPKRSSTKAGRMNMNIKTDEKPLHTILQSDQSSPIEQKKDDKKVLPKELQSKELIKQQEAIAATYTSASVGTIFDTVFNILHARYPACSKLSTQERISLGEAWYPIFSEYLTGEGSKWIMPVIITAPIVIVRFSEIQRQKKEEELKEQYGKDYFDPSQQKKDKKKDEPKKSKWSDRL